MVQQKQKKKKHAKSQQHTKTNKIKTDIIVCEGQVLEVLPNTRFKIRLLKFGNDVVDGKIIIEAVLAGKIRQHFIRILTGDYVTVELAPYNLQLGRITYRYNRPR